MSIEIKVPVLPESVADAQLLEWRKRVGDTVRRDEILVEVETDKVVLEIPAPQDGVLTEIIEQSGTTVLAEQALARIEQNAVQRAVPSEQITPEKIESNKIAPAKIEPVANTPIAPLTANEPLANESLVDEPPLSPAVRRLIDETGIDPNTISASGRDGRLTKEDVLNHIADVVDPSMPTASATAIPTEQRQETRQPMSRLRQTIATRLVQCQQNAALLTTFNEVNMQHVLTIREKYKAEFMKKHGTKLGFMSFFVRASTIALQRFPLLNAYIDGTDIVQHNYNDIGIAVSSPRGLVVPVLRNCEGLRYAEIESQIQDFGMRAKAGKITMEELTGGTFTITNGGVFGSLLSTPIVNPPQSAILGMHKIQPRPMAENGAVVILPMMYLALSYDHRIIDGKEAVQFLLTVKEILEDPARGLLDC